MHNKRKDKAKSEQLPDREMVTYHFKRVNNKMNPDMASMKWLYNEFSRMTNTRMTDMNCGGCRKIVLGWWRKVIDKLNNHDRTTGETT